MSDIADAASEIEQEAIRIALLNHHAKQATVSSKECQDCGEPIPLARAALIKTTRCVLCQQALEAKKRLYQGI